MINRLYIHVPFCVRKCAYCSFYSIPIENGFERSYLDKIAKEMERKADLCGALRSIYIGGGTPNLLSASSMERLFLLIRKHFKFDDFCEISIECNPESMDKCKAELFANFANRISVGVQSFDVAKRDILGRRAVDADIFRAFELLCDCGIKNLSCDLINSIPQQSPKNYESDLKKAISLGISHLSSYSLSVEEGTLLANKNIVIDEDIEIEMWNISDEILSSAGMKRYEISNFCKNGAECIHNLEIWFGDRYLGLGPSASSFDGKKRWTESANFATWLGDAKPEYDIISERRRAAEILAFGFRTLRKWKDEIFFQRSGFRLSDWEDVFRELAADVLIKYDGVSAISTQRGLLLWNNLAAKIMNLS